MFSKSKKSIEKWLEINIYFELFIILNIVFKNAVKQREFWMVEYNFFVTLTVLISAILVLVLLIKDSNITKEILANFENKGMKFKYLVVLQFSFLGMVWIGDYYLTNHIYYSIVPLLCLLIVTIVCKVILQTKNVNAI